MRAAVALGVVGPPLAAAGVAGAARADGCTACAATAASIAPPLRPVQRLLRADPRPAHGVLVRLLDAPTPPDYTLDDAQRDKLDLVCRKLGLRAGDAAARRRLRLGLAVACTPPSTTACSVTGVTLSREQRAFVRQARRRARPRRPGRDPAAGLPRRRRRPVRRGRVDRDGRARRRRRTTRCSPRRCTDWCARAGRVLVQQMSRAGAAPGGGPVHRVLHRARHAHAPGRARPSRCSKTPGSRCATSQAMREHYVRTVRGVATPPSRRAGTRSSTSSARRSRGCGGSTWSAAALAFERGPHGRRPDPGVRRTADGVSGMPSTRPGSDEHVLRRLAFDGSAFVARPARTALGVLGCPCGDVHDRRVQHRHSVIDMVWGLGFVVALVVVRRVERSRRRDADGCSSRCWSSVWGLRLAIYIALAGPRQGRGPALRRRCSAKAKGNPNAVRAPVGLPHPGRRALVRLAAGAGGRCTRAAVRPWLSWVGVAVWVVGVVLRGGRRLPARGVQGRPGEQGRGDGPWPVALHPPPQLLRRRLRLVGPVPRRRPAWPGVLTVAVAADHDVRAGARDRRQAAREADGRPSPATPTTSRGPAGSCPCRRRRLLRNGNLWVTVA